MLRTEVGAIFFDDDMSDVIDMAINAKGFREAYEKLNGHAWIKVVDDDGVVSGLMKLDEESLYIMESFFFRDVFVEEILVNLDITIDELNRRVKKIRKTIIRAM